MKYDKTAVIALGASLALLAGYFYLNSKDDKKKPTAKAPTPVPTPTPSEVGSGVNPASSAWVPLRAPFTLVRGRVYRLTKAWNAGVAPEATAVDRLAYDSNPTAFGVASRPFPSDWPEIISNDAGFNLDSRLEFTAVRDLPLPGVPSGFRIWERR